MSAPGPRRHPLEARLPPPLVAAVVGLAMWGGARLLGSAPPGAAREWIARGLGAVALVLALLAGRSFLRAGTTLDPHRPEKTSSLVEHGLYRHSRNPMYLAMALGLLAWAIHLGTPWVLLGPLAFVAYVTRFQIRPEERVMAEKFGDRYSEYCRRTRRWL